jgi:hypothetical protein
MFYMWDLGGIKDEREKWAGEIYRAVSAWEVEE